MKSFKQYITEAKKGNGPFPLSDADKKRLERQRNAPTQAAGDEIRQELDTTKERASRRKRVAPSSPTGRKLGVTPRVLDAPDGTKVVTNMPEPSRGTTGEVVDRVVDKLKTTDETQSRGKTASSSRPRGDTAKSGDLGSFIRGEQGKGRSVTDTMQDVAGRKGAGYDFPKDAGTEKPRRTKPGSYVVDDKPKSKPRVKGNKPTGRLSKGNLVFPGDTSGAYAAAKAKLKSPEGVKQADVSKSIKARLKNVRAARTTPPTVAKVSDFIRGQEKGYIGKKGTPTPQGIQNYAIRSKTAGYGDANYNAAKRGISDPKAASKSVENLVKRAVGGEKFARHEVRRTYKKITKNYPDIVPSSARTKAGFSALGDTKPAASTPAASTPAAPSPKAPPAPKAPKVDDTPKSVRTTSKSVSKGGSASTGGKPPVLTKSRIQKKLNLAPTPATPASTSAPKSKVTTNFTPGPGAPTKPGGLKDFLQKAERITKIPAGSRVPSSGGKSKGTTPVKVNPSKAKFGMGPGRSITKTGGSKLRVPKSLADKVQKSLASRKAKPSLGVGGQTIRKDSVTLPKSATASKTALRGKLLNFGGRALGAGFAAYDTYQGYKTARSKGFDKTTSVARGATRAGSGAAGAALGAKAGAAIGGTIGSIVPGAGTAIGAGLGGLVGGAVGYASGSGLADKVLNFFDKKRGIGTKPSTQAKQPTNTPGQTSQPKPKTKKTQYPDIRYTGT